MYIESSFLESVLNESAYELSTKINSFNGDNKFEFFRSVSESIEQSELEESTKSILLSTLCNSLQENKTFNIDALDEAALDSILEFKGNESKNEAFKECLKDLEALLTYFISVIEKGLGYMDQILALSKKAKNSPKEFKKCVDEMDKFADEFVSWKKQASKSICGSVTWKTFASQIKKFNNKYSEITMEEKKALSAKVEKMIDKVFKICTPWYDMKRNGKLLPGSSAKYEELRTVYKELEKIDKSYANSVNDIFTDFDKYIGSEINPTLNDMFYVMTALNIKFEESWRFKLVNKVLK